MSPGPQSFLVNSYFVVPILLFPVWELRSSAISFPSVKGGGTRFRGTIAPTCLDPPWLPTWDSQALDFPGRRKEGRDRFRVFKGFKGPVRSVQHHSTQLTGEMLGLTEQITVIKIHFLNCLPLGPVYLAAQ